MTGRPLGHLHLPPGGPSRRTLFPAAARSSPSRQAVPAASDQSAATSAQREASGSSESLTPPLRLRVPCQDQEPKRDRRKGPGPPRPVLQPHCKFTAGTVASTDQSQGSPAPAELSQKLTLQPEALTPAPPLPGCVTSGSFCALSGPLSPHPHHGTQKFMKSLSPEPGPGSALRGAPGTGTVTTVIIVV